MAAGRKCLGVGIIGCGAISGIYIKNLARFTGVRLVAVADLDPERARAKAAEAGEGVRALTVSHLLADDAVDIVLNLTVPLAHAQVSLAALQAGKHVYGEKPLGIDGTEARAVLAAATAGLRVGCAPDTFLGAGIQTARELIDAGAIGDVVAASAFMLTPGHESWHPDPAFYYQRGGGPMFDMGPYYLTALVALLGPVDRVAGLARRTHPTRTITSDKRKGEVIPVDVPTHFATSLAFASGPLATLMMTFDCYPGDLPRIEIYGTKGVLSVPDPNTFGETAKGWGDLRLREGRGDWKTIQLRRPYGENWRGLGVAEMAAAIRANRPHLASGELAGHVVEVMEASVTAGESGRAVDIRSHAARPAPLADEAL